jgi:hypothetical protein
MMVEPITIGTKIQQGQENMVHADKEKFSKSQKLAGLNEDQPSAKKAKHLLANGTKIMADALLVNYGTTNS